MKKAPRTLRTSALLAAFPPTSPGLRRTVRGRPPCDFNRHVSIYVLLVDHRYEVFLTAILSGFKF